MGRQYPSLDGVAHAAIQDRVRTAQHRIRRLAGAAIDDAHPKLFDLRSDPFERGEESFNYNTWFIEHVPFQYAAQAIVHEWLESFRKFPPRQKAASFTVNRIVEKLMPRS